MKYRFAGFVAFSALFLMVSSAGAAESLSASETAPADQEAASKTAAPKPPKIDEKKMAKQRELVEKKKKELNGSEWKVNTGTSDPKAKGGPDTLTFQNDMVTMASFSKQGFGPTNYTISVPSEESDIAIFETMQTAKDGVIFIRGEWKKDTMQGVITEQTDGGKSSRSWWFTSSGRASISPVAETKEAAQEQETEEAPKALSSTEAGTSVSAEAPAPAAPSSTKSRTSKKDKGWF